MEESQSNGIRLWRRIQEPCSRVVLCDGSRETEIPGAIQFCQKGSTAMERGIWEPVISVRIGFNSPCGSESMRIRVHVDQVHADQSPRCHSPCGSVSGQQNQGRLESRQTKSPSGTEQDSRRRRSLPRRKNWSRRLRRSRFGECRGVREHFPQGKFPTENFQFLTGLLAGNGNVIT